MYRSAEYVSEKHPDKLCDIIADTIATAYLRQDKNAHTAIEVVGGHGKIYVTGEVKTSWDGELDLHGIVEDIVGNDFATEIVIAKQSSEIAAGVDTGGAGDQGIMVGYATNETPEKMPLEHVLARDLCHAIYTTFPYDGKTLVVCKDGKVSRIVASFQNAPQDELSQVVRNWAIGKKIEWAQDPILFINPAGDWNIGGFDADTGLTGRKICMDNYGPRVPIGGGSFSGKDGTKVDRSGAYRARELALSILNSTPDAQEVYTYLQYAIGEKYPIAMWAEIIYEDGHRDQANFMGYEDLELSTPASMVERYFNYDLENIPQTARWGHFGWLALPWEQAKQ